MEFVSYDPSSETSTVKISDIELVDLHSIICGIQSTLSQQDLTILGVVEDRIADLQGFLMYIMQRRNDPQS